MNQPTLDYRRPGALAIPAVRVRQCFKTCEAMFWARVFGGLIAGAIGTCIPTLLVGLYLVMRDVSHSWTLFFLVGIITIPLGLLFGWTSFGDKWIANAEQDMRTFGSGYPTPWGKLSYWDGRSMYAPGGEWFYLQLLVFGPRILLGTAHNVRMAWRLRRSCRERSAELVARLEQLEHGVALAELVRDHEDPNALGDALAYLQFHQWIDLSKNGDRIWLLTIAKRRLGIQPTP